MHRIRIVVVALLLLCAAARDASAQIALLDSSANTREFFARHYAGCFAPTFYLPDGEEYQRYFRGWEFVLQEMGLPYTIINDSQVTPEVLSRFSLLILSNTASLSAEQTRAIHQWTIRGGKLLATFGSSYKDIVVDPREADRLKKQKGGTFGLHQLWHDPMTKVFSSTLLGGSVEIEVTRYAGPTAGLQGKLAGNILGYGALANILQQRPRQHHDVLAWVRLAGDTASRYPAIVSTRSAHGHTVYFAFAPEYIVSKEFDLPAVPACPDGQNWAGRSEHLRVLMRDSVEFLLAQ